ncbi:hypothetical protein [Salsipaludibacter albus]|uniref:hypothetical protein n=1 Tax=Salsipaludibacter albus TaxID=2849650 RepID=UPI001EE4572C|nr:hypothetical protein [Salsipaludibacter albus]MBY5163722.1 hypothetical protein [Salsipaludibacter albus]
MSWDVFVQDIPHNANRPKDIPGDFQPTPLQLDRASVVRIAHALDIGTINDSDPELVRWEGPGFDIELNMPSDPVAHFAMHCRGDIAACRQARPRW